LEGKELLVSKLNPSKGCIIIAEKNDLPIIASTEFVPLVADEQKLDTGYLYYVYKSQPARELIVAKAQSATRSHQRVNPSDITKLEVPLPPLPTQRRIAAYLDQETTRIDALIKAKERLVELLEEKQQAVITRAVTKGLDPDAPMQDSGVDWLGEVPVGWKVVPMRYLTDKIGSGVTPKGGSQVYQKTGIPFLRSQNIHFSGLKLDDVAYISNETHEEMANSHVVAGDVLLNITGASIGRCFYYQGELGEVNVNQHVCIIRPNKDLNTKYLNLFLASYIGQQQVALSQTGGGREGLSFESIKGFFIPLPPSVTHQEKIVKEVELVVERINELQAFTKRSICLLAERRSALISATVTGQLQV